MLRHSVKLLVLCFVLGGMCYLVIIRSQGSNRDGVPESQMAADNRIDGLWQVTSLKRLADNDATQGTTFEFRDTMLTIRDRDGYKEIASVTIRPAANSAEIDLMFVAEDNATTIVQGIYKHEGDHLTLCLADAVSPRYVDAIICGPGGVVLTGRPRGFDARHGTLVRCRRIK